MEVTPYILGNYTIIPQVIVTLTTVFGNYTGKMKRNVGKLPLLRDPDLNCTLAIPLRMVGVKYN